MGGPSAHVCGLPPSTSHAVKSISLADHKPRGGKRMTDGGESSESAVGGFRWVGGGGFSFDQLLELSGECDQQSTNRYKKFIIPTAWITLRAA